ncbi:MAG TPA: hypothetical protein VJM11_10855 [Nevskiaceae bacterium]|nr:hypothetical protein [Nevskiaceae bacterium]
MTLLVARAVAVGAALLGAAAAFAHEDPHERIDEVTKALEQSQAKPDVDQADLLIRRGRLNLDARHEQDAKADLVRALQLDPARYEARYYLAQAQLRLGQLEAALRSVDAFLAAADSDAARSRGLALRGDVLMAASEPKAAADAYAAGLALEADPNPDHVVAAANAFHAAGQTPRAIEMLDHGIAQLGSLIVLEERAIAIEVDAQRYDEAVARVDRLLAAGQRRPFLLYRKGQVLEAAKRTDAARAAYRAAIAELETLPAGRRSVAGTQALRESADAALKSLDAQAGAAAAASPPSDTARP